MSPSAAFCAAALSLATLFVVVPGLDIWIAGWFYSQGSGFVGSGPGLARGVEVAIDILTWAAILAPIVILVRWAIGGPLPAWAPAGVSARFLTTLLLGPGLLVNLILKNQWGRPRPRQTTEFGGALEFEPAFTMSQECWRNCSFVAGHPSLIFAFYAVALALPSKVARILGLFAVTLVGGLVGIGRMAQGAHFASDVVFSGLFVFAVAWLVDRAARQLPPWTPLDLWHQVRRARLLLRRYLGWVPQLFAWRARLRGGRTGWAYSLVALAFLLALCIGWLDRNLALWLKTYDDSTITDIFRIITLFGKSWPYFLAFAILGVGCAWLAGRATEDRRRQVLKHRADQFGFLFWSLAAAGIASQILKFLLGRARPRVFFGDGSYGFDPFSFATDWTSMPSGHTITAVALALAVTMLWRRLWPATVAFAVLVALSRIVTTVHFVGDTIAGAVVAVIAVWFVRRFYQSAGATFFDDGDKGDSTGHAGEFGRNRNQETIGEPSK